MACSSDSDDPLPVNVVGIGEVVGSGGEDVAQETNPEPNIPLGSSRLDIDGKWQKSCDYNERLDIGTVATLEFSGDRFSLGIKEYSDNSCTQLTRQETDTGNIIFGVKLTTPSGLTAHEIDLDFDHGGVWRSLISRHNNVLSLKTASGGADRPSDLYAAKTYSLIN